jgi:hypothetical protein
LHTSKNSQKSIQSTAISMQEKIIINDTEPIVETNDIKCLTDSSNPTIKKKESDNELPQLKLDCNAIDINNVDESFDSLCQVVSKLSGNENNILCKNIETDNNLKEDEKLILQNSRDNLKNSGKNNVIDYEFLLLILEKNFITKVSVKLYVMKSYILQLIVIIKNL